MHVSQHAILRIIQDGVFSLDKFKLVRSLEMLTGLCGFEGNEAIICDWLRPSTIAHIFEIVGVKDIMMCVYTLECLYQISEMGDTACDLIAESPRAIQQLVSMATLEAVSFGPAGLAGMKVVEYQPQFQGGQMPPPQHIQQVPHPAQFQPRPVPQQAPMTVRQVIQNNLALQQVQQMQRDQHHPQVPPSPSSSAPTGPPTPSQMPNGTKMDRRTGNLPVRPIAPSTSGDSQIEQLTENWIKQNCVFEPTMSTPRGELYAAYVDDLRNIHHSMSSSLATFSGVIKNLYPDMTFKMAQPGGDLQNNGLMIVAQGIRLVRPHRLAPTASQSATEQHPLMRKMLSTEKTEEENGMVNGHVEAETKKEEEVEATTEARQNSKVVSGDLRFGRREKVFL